MTLAFDSVQAFFAMGKHGFYVWLSYGVGFVVILFNILLAKRQRTQAFEQVRRLVRLEASSPDRPDGVRSDPGPESAVVGADKS